MTAFRMEHQRDIDFLPLVSQFTYVTCGPNLVTVLVEERPSVSTGRAQGHGNGTSLGKGQIVI